MFFGKRVKRGIWIALASLFVVLMASVYVDARPAEHEKFRSEAGREHRHGRLGLVSTRELMGSDVTSVFPEAKGEEEEKTWTEKMREWYEGERLGKVKEIMFDNDNEVVHCVVVSAEGRFYPVPWQAFSMRCLKGGALKSEEKEYGEAETEEETKHEEWHKGEKGKLCLKISKEDFKNAPSIDEITMKNLSDPALKQEVKDFYTSHGLLRGVRAKRAMGAKAMVPGGTEYREWAMANLVNCSDVINMHVEDFAGDDIAEIEDVIICTHHGTLAYALADFGGFWGMAEETAAVPWSALTIEPDKDIALLDATQEIMTATVIEKDDWGRLSDRDFARRIHRRFEAEPYWEVYAFVPVVITTESLSVWQPGSTYNKRFNPDTMTTIQGRIRNVGAFRPQEGSARGVRLRVKPEEDKAVTIFAGPRQYAMMQNIRFKAGEDITVKGSKIQIGDRTVIMASEITIGDRTLQLRDAEGRPQWRLESTER